MERGEGGWEALAIICNDDKELKGADPRLRAYGGARILSGGTMAPGAASRFGGGGDTRRTRHVPLFAARHTAGEARPRHSYLPFERVHVRGEKPLRVSKFFCDGRISHGRSGRSIRGFF